MKRKYKTTQVIEMFNALNEFINKDITLPANFAWIIDDNYEELKKVVLKFDKYREKLFKPLNEKDAFESSKENQIIVKTEYVDEFTKLTEEINSVLALDNELEIKIANRSDVPLMISNKDLRAIKFMIE